MNSPWIIFVLPEPLKVKTLLIKSNDIFPLLHKTQSHLELLYMEELWGRGVEKILHSRCCWWSACDLRVLLDKCTSGFLLWFLWPSSVMCKKDRVSAEMKPAAVNPSNRKKGWWINTPASCSLRRATQEQAPHSVPAISSHIESQLPTLVIWFLTRPVLSFFLLSLLLPYQFFLKSHPNKAVCGSSTKTFSR